jgi:spermidine/putrescine transport system permease protein
MSRLEELQDRFALSLNRIEVSDGVASRLLQLYTFLLYFFLYTPVVVVAILSFHPHRTPVFPMPGFTLKWYSTFIPIGEYNPDMVAALVRSFGIAVVVSISTTLIATAAALGMVRGSFRRIRTSSLNTVFFAPMVVPAVVTGIAVLIFYTIVNVRGILSIVLGHILIAIPFTVAVVASQLYGFDRSVEEAANILGARRIRTFYEVTLPIIWPGVLAALLFSFTISFENFTQTFFWMTGDNVTLPVFIYSMIRSGLDPSVNAIGTIIVLFSAVLVFTAEQLYGRFE